MEYDLGDSRVEDYVSMVGQEEKFLAVHILEKFDSVVREIMGCVVENPLDSLVHHGSLELINAFNTLESIPEKGLRHIREYHF